MQITVNGQSRECPPTLTVAQLLEELALSATQVAVERNRQIVPRSQHANQSLTAGDEVEIVHFIGGG